MAGMLAGLVAGGAFAMTSRHGDAERLWWLAGAGFAQLRLLANLFDGMVAIESRKVSAVGELFNEVPDRVSDVAILVGLGFAAGSSPQLGLWSAIAAVSVAYLRAMGKVAGGEQEFCGPMAKPQRMFLVTLAGIAAAGFPASSPTITKTILWIIIGGCLFTGMRRLYRTARTASSKQP